MYGTTTSKPVHKVGQPKSKASPPRALMTKAKDTPQGKLDQPISKVAGGRCGKKTHTDRDCPHIYMCMTSAITVKGGTVAIHLQVQETAGHWSQVPEEAGCSKDSEEINAPTVPAS